MSKIIGNAVALAALTAYGLKDADSPEEVENAVIKLSGALKAAETAHGLEKAQREALEGKIKTADAVALNALVDQAVTDGQILGDQKDTFVALGFEGAKKIISGLPKKVTLGTQVSNSDGGAGAADPKSFDDFAAMPLAAQLEFKNSNEAAYKALFT